MQKWFARFFDRFIPELYKLKKEGGIPSKDHVIYKKLTQRGYVNPARMFAAQGFLGLMCTLVFAAFVAAFHSSKDYSGVFIFAAVVCMFVAWGFAMNYDDPVEVIRETARLAQCTPRELCQISSHGLKLRAMRILYLLAELHKERQAKYDPSTPEFQETYRVYSYAHQTFQKSGLIPEDIAWTPYFNKTATTDF